MVLLYEWLLKPIYSELSSQEEVLIPIYSKSFCQKDMLISVYALLYSQKDVLISTYSKLFSNEHMLIPSYRHLYSPKLYVDTIFSEVFSNGDVLIYCCLLSCEKKMMISIIVNCLPMSSWCYQFIISFHFAWRHNDTDFLSCFLKKTYWYQFKNMMIPFHSLSFLLKKICWHQFILNRFPMKTCWYQFIIVFSPRYVDTNLF